MEELEHSSQPFLLTEIHLPRTLEDVSQPELLLLLEQLQMELTL